MCSAHSLLRALCHPKAAETDRSISELANEAAKAALAQDAGDIEDFEVREEEPDYAFEDVVKDLKRRGRI